MTYEEHLKQIEYDLCHLRFNKIISLKHIHNSMLIKKAKKEINDITKKIISLEEEIKKIKSESEEQNND